MNSGKCGYTEPGHCNITQVLWHRAACWWNHITNLQQCQFEPGTFAACHSSPLCFLSDLHCHWWQTRKTQLLYFTFFLKIKSSSKECFDRLLIFVTIRTKVTWIWMMIMMITWIWNSCLQELMGRIGASTACRIGRMHCTQFESIKSCYSDSD